MEAAAYPLRRFNGDVPQAPSWFTDIAGQKFDEVFADVDGAKIETLAWGNPAAPGLIFVPGALAHAHWWSFIAPYFRTSHRAVAISLSGMGRSGWRTHYDINVHKRDLIGVIAAHGLLDGRKAPIIVGHSAGARPVVSAAAEIGALLGGSIIVDSVFRPEHVPRHDVTARTHHRQFASLAAALARYRLSPPQHCTHPFLVDWVARHSIMETATGWQWRFDPKIASGFGLGDTWAQLRRCGCPLAFISGANSAIATSEALAMMARHTPPGSRYVLIEGANHHVMLDQPQALVAAIGKEIALFDRRADRHGQAHFVPLSP